MASVATASRLPPGHPEGFLEAFARLYGDFAEQLRARLEQRAARPETLLVPTVEDGCDGVRFVLGAVKSSHRGGAWLSRDDWADPTRLFHAGRDGFGWRNTGDAG